jgi:8-oxo-dGTP pyrophosphatase MutT (NUDIX family)
MRPPGCKGRGCVFLRKIETIWNNSFNVKSNQMTRIIKDASFGALVMTPKRTVLLIKQFSQNGGFWALPKGHKDNGESDAEAAIREVNEECGLSLTTDHLLPGVWCKESYMFKGGLYGDAWLRHASYPNDKKRPRVIYDKMVMYGLALVNSELPVRPQEDEVEEVGWFPIEEAIRKLRHPSQRHTLNTLYRAISA